MQVTEIKATILPDIKIQRVAAYARVSSDKDAALHSVSAQISYYNELISNHPGWDFAGVYADEDYSGTKEARPEFQRLLADCHTGKIDMVITKSVTRFARNTVILLQTIRELKEQNVDVYFEEQKLHSISTNGELMLTLIAMYAEEEARNVSENQKWRIRRMFEEGRPNTGRMLGYCLKDGELTIIPEEAELVKRTFKDYLSGMGQLAIVKQLNKEGIKTIWGNEWHEDNIYKIIRNEKYTGDMLLQKTYVEDFRTKKGKINRGERRKYFVENSHEPIIDKETFQAAQAEIERRKKRIRIPEKQEKTQFSSLITCANCGKHFRRRIANSGGKYAKPVWVCSTFMNKGRDVCDMRQIPEDILIAKTKEALNLESLENINLTEYLDGIICDRQQITYRLKTGEVVTLPWELKSRKDSWTDEMKQAARTKTLERSTLHEPS